MIKNVMKKMKKPFVKKTAYFQDTLSTSALPRQFTNYGDDESFRDRNRKLCGRNSDLDYGLYGGSDGGYDFVK